MAESHHIAKTPVPHNARFIDLTGQRFGKLTVIGYSHRDPKNNRACWTVRCDCGKVLTQDGTRLRNGSVKSCGCLIGESAKQRFTKHGKSFSPEWRSWRAMNNRCHNPNYKDYEFYHSRGITVCEEWRKSFEAFWKHVGDRPTLQHTLERIDTTKGYFPGNVRWATRREQAMNRVTTWVQFRGKYYALYDLARRMAVDGGQLNLLLGDGLSADEAIKQLREEKRLAEQYRKSLQ